MLAHYEIIYPPHFAPTCPYKAFALCISILCRDFYTLLDLGNSDLLTKRSIENFILYLKPSKWIEKDI
jgi:hypothetical protein